MNTIYRTEAYIFPIDENQFVLADMVTCMEIDREAPLFEAISNLRPSLWSYDQVSDKDISLTCIQYVEWWCKYGRCRTTCLHLLFLRKSHTTKSSSNFDHEIEWVDEHRARILPILVKSHIWTPKESSMCYTLIHESTRFSVTNRASEKSLVNPHHVDS